MNQSFYTAAVGAQQQQNRMNVQGNNIANVNTYGYKNMQANFASLLYRNMEGIDNARLPHGVGSRVISTDTDYKTGGFAHTGNALDFAIQGEGFFALRDPQSGAVSYTRDGSFTRAPLQEADANGNPSTNWYLSDGVGRLVLDGQNAPIRVTENTLSADIGVFTFAHLNGMYHAGDNCYLPAAKNGAPILMQNAKLAQGYLEGSNVDLAQELTRVIESQRSFSYALKMVQTSDEVETTINGLRT